MSKQPRPKKVTLDSPFPEAEMAKVPSEQEAAVLAEIASLDRSRIIMGGNQVLRAIEKQTISLVVLAGKNHPKALVEPLHAGCCVARIHGAMLAGISAENMGKALGVRRALLIGITSDGLESVPILASFSQIPEIAWMQPEGLHRTMVSTTVESKTSESYYKERMDRKDRFREKQAELKKKHVVQKRLENHVLITLQQTQKKKEKKRQRTK